MARLPIGLTLAEIRGALGLLRRLPLYVRRRLTYEEAVATVQRRLGQRAENFCLRVREQIWPEPHHPYRLLLENAGYRGPSEIASLIQQAGLESGLRELLRRGVYLTVDESRGRCEVRRGRLTFRVQSQQLQNPHTRREMMLQSSGSSGQAVSVSLDLDSRREHLANMLLTNVAGPMSPPPARSMWTIPTAASMGFNLDWQVCFGEPMSGRFSLIDPHQQQVPLRVRLGNLWLELLDKVLRLRTPRLQYAPAEDPAPVLAWIARVKRDGRVPSISTYPSAALKLAEAAASAGVDVSGTWIVSRGEPLTQVRRERLEAAGMRVQTIYGTTETLAVAYSCDRARLADEAHLLEDMHAIIQAGDDVPSLPAETVLFTTLNPKSAMVLINFSSGDTAVLEHGGCGCRFEELGWRTRLHTIRSVEESTGAGMTFASTDAVRVLEEVLPQRFGGSPVDYQLVERESADGRPELEIVVDPGIGPVDAAQVVQVFLQELGSSSVTQQLMSLVWQDASIVRVVRRPPARNAAGKISYFRSYAADGERR